MTEGVVLNPTRLVIAALIGLVILLVLIIPFTRAVVGKSIGTTAAIVPLTVSAIPYIARVFETSLRETDAGVIEAVRSFGASD